MSNGTEYDHDADAEAYEAHQRERGELDEPAAVVHKPTSASQVGKKRRGDDSEVGQLFDSRAAEMRRILPPWIKYERFYFLVHRALERSDALHEVPAGMVVAAVYEAACLGLEPNTPLGHCSIIPYKGKNPKVLCQLEYRGLVFLAAQNGIHLTAEAICENDEFEYRDGSDPFLHHRQPLRGERGHPYAGYAIFELPDGRRLWRICGADRIDTAMRVSKAFQYAESSGKCNSPWHEHRASMIAKTAVHHAIRFIPQAPILQRAALVDAAKGAGEDARHEPIDVTSQQGEDDAKPLSPKRA